MSAIASGRNLQILKWLFFAAMAAATLLVIWTDERFLFSPDDPEWRHIAAYKWLLLPHGLAGATALFAGPFQFSDRIRTNWPKLHHWAGRIYIGAVCLIAAPLGGYIGGHYEPQTIHIEQYFQAGLWWLATAIAFACILNRQIPLHKIWMMRSYGLCCIFVISRVPDGFHIELSNQGLADLLWSLIITALIVPDLVQTSRELARLVSRRRASGAVPAFAG